MIYAIDFDGTLCVDRFPEIGEPRLGVIEFLKAERRAGARLILWTCRSGTDLEAAVVWCAGHGLEFDAVNNNLPELVARYGNDCRKVYADRYIDDRNLLIDLPESYVTLHRGGLQSAT